MQCVSTPLRKKCCNMTPWIFLQYLLLPLLAVGGYFLGGAWNFLVPGVCFIVRPLATLVLPSRKAQHNRSTGTRFSDNDFHLVILLYVPVLLGFNIWVISGVVHVVPFSISWIGLLLSTGMVNGIIGFTLAHEFIHRFSLLDQLAGHLLLLQMIYLHYSIEHVWGHHVYACTPEDPHTARRNESFYLFLARAVYGTFRNAWNIERSRLPRNRYHARHRYNRIFCFLLIEAVLISALAWWGGTGVLAFYLLQSLVATSLLHIVNYLQHYGLMRTNQGTNQYEKINTHHAWRTESGHEATSLFQLEDHADHHMHPGRPYHELHHHEDSPVLPGGYTGMIWLALVPPLWFRIMNPRIPSVHTSNTPI